VHRATIGRELRRGRGSPSMIMRTCARICGTGWILAARTSAYIWTARLSCKPTPVPPVPISPNGCARKVHSKRIKWRTLIHDRPAEVWDRIQFGHWESDSVLGVRGTGARHERALQWPDSQIPSERHQLREPHSSGAQRVHHRDQQPAAQNPRLGNPGRGLSRTMRPIGHSHMLHSGLEFGVGWRSPKLSTSPILVS
jgi:hypothetical protein